MRQKNLGKLARRCASFAMGCALTVTTALSAVAAPVPEATIDAARTGSLTLYKYDITRAGDDGVSGDFIATGRVDQTAESAYADYAIQGVVFTYLKVGEMNTMSVVDQDNGAAEIKVIYGLDEASVNALGVDENTAVDTRDGRKWFLSDTLIDALADSLAADEAGAKNTLENYVLDNGGTDMTETDAGGMTTASDLPLGLYLVAETAVPEDVVCTVNPFLVSLPMTDIDGKSWNYDVTVYPKNNTGSPTLEKEVAEVTGAKDIAYSDTATASDGDVVAYQITSILPRITSEATYLTTYTFLDEMSSGLTYNKGDVTLTWYDAGGKQAAEWTETDSTQKFAVAYGNSIDGGTTMEIKMTEAGLDEINPAYSQYKVVIDYACTLNSDDSVVYGDDGNPNKVTLTWKRTNSNYYDTLEDDCIVYTYGLTLTKKFSSGNGDFAAVKFVVQNQTDGYFITAEKAADGIYYVTGMVGADEKAATVFSPDESGQLEIYGLEDDIYIATETETAAGYNLLKSDIIIGISSAKGDHCQTGSATVNGDSVTMLPVAESANALVPLIVVNERGYDIPFTGDTNTFLLPVVGIIGAAMLFFAARRRRERKEMA